MTDATAVRSALAHYTLGGVRTVCGLPVRGIIGPLDTLGNRRRCPVCAAGWSYGR